MKKIQWVSSQCTRTGFMSAMGLWRFFHYLSRSHRPSKAMRTAEPIEEKCNSQRLHLWRFNHSNLALYQTRPPTLSHGSRCSSSLCTDGHSLRHKVTALHVQHSSSRKCNKACRRMAEDRWLRAYCCLFSAFDIISIFYLFLFFFNLQGRFITPRKLIFFGVILFNWEERTHFWVLDINLIALNKKIMINDPIFLFAIILLKWNWVWVTLSGLEQKLQRGWTATNNAVTLYQISRQCIIFGWLLDEGIRKQARLQTGHINYSFKNSSQTD